MEDNKKEKKLKPKLLIATDNFLPRIDGIAVFLKNIISKLSTTYDVTVVSPNFGKVESKDFKHIRIPLSNIGMGDYTGAKVMPRKIKNLVKKSDVVFTQTIGPIGVLAVYYAKKAKVPVASFMHSIEWELVPMATKTITVRRLLFPFMKILTKFIYNKTNLVILPSEGIAEIVGWRGIKSKKVVVNLGVDSDIFAPAKLLNSNQQKRIEELKNEYDLEGKFVIGTHGRIAREKDLFTLLRAFRRLQKKYSDVKLLVIGEGIPAIKERLQKVDGVILPGAVQEVNVYLNLIDVYVTTSLTETTSLSTLEAMSTGLTVISTPIGFIKEYIKNNVNGFFFPTKDAFSLYKQLDLLKNNNSLVRAVGERARKTVSSAFQWNDTVLGIKDAIKSLEK